MAEHSVTSDITRSVAVVNLRGPTCGIHNHYDQRAGRDVRHQGSDDAICTYRKISFSLPVEFWNS